MGPMVRKDPLLYKEDMVAIFVMHWLIIFVGSAKICIPGMFSRVVVFLNPRVFPVGNPYLILKEGEDLSYISSFWHLSKLTPLATVLFM